jgi:hypothetical protein
MQGARRRWLEQAAAGTCSHARAMASADLVRRRSHLLRFLRRLAALASRRFCGLADSTRLDSSPDVKAGGVCVCCWPRVLPWRRTGWPCNRPQPIFIATSSVAPPDCPHHDPIPIHQTPPRRPPSLFDQAAVIA